MRGRQLKKEQTDTNMNQHRTQERNKIKKNKKTNRLKNEQMDHVTVTTDNQHTLYKRVTCHNPKS